MMKHTKIVATVSDRRCEIDFIRSLANEGVDVVRMNSAHLTREGMERIVRNARAAAPRLAVMVDTKGPEIRTTVIADGADYLDFSTGDKVDFIGSPDTPTTHECICLNYADIAAAIHPDDRLLIDDGELEFLITAIDPDGTIHAEAENSGRLGSRKSVNVPGAQIPLPAVTERDREYIRYAAALGVDFVAHSFVRSAADVQAIQDIIDSLGVDMKIISKIENQEGVDNFDSILAASYGIMVARGDLGIEVPAETIPRIQLNMINKCMAAHKPVIVATQMLHTMIEHPRPTRAEISDVANAVYQRADALMLSGETASGKYPVEAVRTMARVAVEVERELTARPHIPHMTGIDVASFIARQAVASEVAVGTKAIITDAYQGRTARHIASYRGLQPVFAICFNPAVARRLALSYGIVPFLPTPHDEDAPLPVYTSDIIPSHPTHGKPLDKLTRAEGLELFKEAVSRPDGLLQFIPQLTAPATTGSHTTPPAPEPPIKRNSLVAYLSGTNAGTKSLEIAPLCSLRRQ